MEESASGYHWRLSIEGQAYQVTASLDGDVLLVSISASETSALDWPRSPADLGQSYALPVFGEGRLVEADDAQWADFLISRRGQMDGSELSLPFWTALAGDISASYILQTPLDANLILANEDGRLSVGARQTFTRFNLDEPYTVRIALGPADPVIGAKYFRDYLEGTNHFRTLAQKAADNPDIAKLAGAPHLYVHDSGPLSPGDITDWKGFVQRFAARRDESGTFSAVLWDAVPAENRKEINDLIEEARGPQGYVSGYGRTTMTRFINLVLPEVLIAPPVASLPGGHDPAAQEAWINAARSALTGEFPGMMADPASWGGGLSSGLVEELQGAGIDTAWIGTANWLEALWHPEAVKVAKDAGYLVGTYDSYASAHPEDLVDTWQTAQQGQEIYEAAAYTREDGRKVTGFAGRGVYVNPLEVRDYARTRMKAVSDAARFNSYFIDVDATGLSYNDYSEDHPTGRAEIIAELRDRIGYIANDLGLVTASENGTWLFSRDLVIGHGITTPPVGWMDPRMRERGSEYYRGTYWPPERPDIYFKSTPLPEPVADAMYAPRHRLPLFQIALHDSIITSHHWEYGSLKPVGQRDRIGLTQILHMVPPLYHLHDSVLKRDMPLIQAYHEVWGPLHAELWDQQMTGFEFLSEDRLVQRTEFADGTALTVNFANEPRLLPGSGLSTGETLPVRGIAVEKGGETRILEMPALD
nr:hypothetical protein GCM10011355_15070 [Aquisalinus luteolus]